MNEQETCYICKEPIGDIGGSIEIDGHKVCKECGLKALDLPEDTELFVSSENEDDDSDDQTEEEEQDSEEEEQDSEDAVEDDSEHRVMDGNPAVIVREEPEEPLHIVRIPINSEEEPVERIGPVETSEQSEETEQSVKEEPEPIEEEPKKGFSAILLQKFQQFKENIGKPRKTVPRRKSDAKKSEKQYDPDSLQERWRRHKLIRNEGYVILKTLTRDSYGEYLLETTLIKAEDLPREAVAVTNEKNTYCLDKIKTSRWYLETHVDPHADYYESQFNASDAALYMTSNKIDNALAIKWTEYSHIDFKRYMWLAIAAMVVVVILIMRR